LFLIAYFCPQKTALTIRIINHSDHPLPRYETSGSAGMDLRAHIPEPIVLGPLERALVPTGLHIELPHGYEAQIRARSGLAIKRGLTMLNSPAPLTAITAAKSNASSSTSPTNPKPSNPANASPK
jgi:hypothetical protein